LITLEIIHRYVEQMDKYYGNVCELDIIFSFTKAYYILDELLLAGELQESSKKNVLRCISQQDALEDMEVGAAFFSTAHSAPHRDVFPSARLVLVTPCMRVLLTAFSSRWRTKSQRSCRGAAALYPHRFPSPRRRLLEHFGG
jgi:hypothetical protein